MKKKEINDLLGENFLLEIFFLDRIGSGRKPFSKAVFSNGVELDKKKFGKFCRLLKHPEEARAFICDKILFTQLNQERKRKGASIGGKAAMKNPLNHVQNRNFEHWSKGTLGVVKAWNKNLTKETDTRCFKISISKQGSKNPMFGREVSQHTRDLLSQKAKDNILSGKWTPNTFNSRTRKTLMFRGVLFRSSWEALFFQAHPEAEYEKLRIPYLTDKNHVYITDFIIGNTVFEIKPQKHVLLKKDKLEIVQQWCNKNNFKFIILDEFALVDLIPQNTVDFEEFDSHTKQLLRGLYASVEKRRNNNAGKGI